MSLKPKSFQNIKLEYSEDYFPFEFKCEGRKIDDCLVWIYLNDNAAKSEIAYLEGNFGTTDKMPKVLKNERQYPNNLLLNLFHMVRCKREYERTGNKNFHNGYIFFLNNAKEAWDRLNTEYKAYAVIVANKADRESAKLFEKELFLRYKIGGDIWSPEKAIEQTSKIDDKYSFVFSIGGPFGNRFTEAIQKDFKNIFDDEGITYAQGEVWGIKAFLVYGQEGSKTSKAAKEFVKILDKIAKVPE